MQDTKADKENFSEIHAMACVVVNDKNEVLLLKISPGKKFFPDKWAVVGAAPLTDKDDRKLIALREMRDELGLEGEIIGEEKEIVANYGNQRWFIKPFLARLNSDKITRNEEHTEAKWVKIGELDNFDLVEGTSKMIRQLLKDRVN